MTFPSSFLARVCLLVLAAVPSPGATAAARAQDAARDRSGDELYAWACAACHGPDGTGAERSRVGFETPLPDFTDCSFASREPAADWFAISHAGGPVRGFDRRMPAFGELLTPDEIGRVVDRVKSFCRDPAWPGGELNLPRPLVTEKAYPEDEAVLTTTVGTGEAAAITNEFLYEQRFGARNQFEVVVPLAMERPVDGGWRRGLGDVAFAIKRVLAHSARRGSILSVTGEIVFPTGKETEGLGRGVMLFEPFLTFGQILPRGMFVQAQAGAELPRDRGVADAEGFWRAAVGRSFEQGRFGRTWSPMVELLGSRELESGATAEWDVVPQMQVTLSKRQHIMLNAGVRTPLTNRSLRDSRVMIYLLWDWFDGGLFDGWR
jgi:mono/diheme cytochrome c family protein